MGAIDLAEALEKLIAHALDCERRLDQLHGLGVDAGSGCSINICEAQETLARSRRADVDPGLVALAEMEARAILVSIIRPVIAAHPRRHPQYMAEAIVEALRKAHPKLQKQKDPA